MCRHRARRRSTHRRGTPTRRGAGAPEPPLPANLLELSGLIDNECHSWDEWGARIGRDEPWERAAEVLRTQYEERGELPLTSAARIAALADYVLAAWLGINSDQLVAGLDLLCVAAASAVVSTFGTGFAETVLLVLADQQNLSAPVRESYLHLLGQLLDSGQEQRGYTDILEQAGKLWRRVAAPVAVNWGIGLVDVLLDVLPRPRQPHRPGHRNRWRGPRLRPAPSTAAAQCYQGRRVVITEAATA